MSDPARAANLDAWRRSGLYARALSGRPTTLAATGRYDTLFRYARRQRLLEDNAVENARPRSSLGCTGPLEVLDLALICAVEQKRVPEMAEFLLSRARWAKRLASETPLAALRAGAAERAWSLADTGNDEQTNLWHLLLAWEYSDAGNPGEARATLQKLLARPRPRLMLLEISGRAATLLRHTIGIDHYIFVDLQTMLDDNDRLALGRELIEAGELEAATALAHATQVITSYKAKLLAAVAKAHAAAGDQVAAGRTAAQAVRAVEEIRDDDEWLAEYLAEAAGAQSLGGDRAGAEATFARAVGLALASHGRRVDGLVAVAVQQAEAGLRDASAETIHLLERAGPVILSNEDSHGEALEAYALACVGQDDIEAAVATLGRMSPTYSHRSRAVRAVCERIAHNGNADRAVSVARQLLESVPRDAVLAAITSVLAAQGSWSRALALVDEVADPGWRSEALVELVGRTPVGAEGAFSDTLSDERIRAAILEIDDRDDRAAMLARYAVTKPPDARSQLFREALELASGLDPDPRWRTLAQIAMIQADHGIEGAPATFARARAVLEEANQGPDWSGHDLWRLGTIQAGHGDGHGARETFAIVLRGPVQDTVGHLAAMSLIGIALAQARAGDRTAARRTAAAATRVTRSLASEQRALIEPFVARMLAEAGDAAAAVEVVYAALDGMHDDEDPLSAAMAAASGAGPTAQRLAADGDQQLALDLLSDVSGQVGPLLADHMEATESLVELAKARAELGDVQGAIAMVAGSDVNRVVGPTAVAVAAAQARRGDLAGAEKTAADIHSVRWRVEARCAIATELSARGDHEAAAKLLRRTGGTIQASAEDAARLLVKVAETQAALDQRAEAKDTLLAARAAAARIDTTSTRATTACRIARTQAQIGDHANAWRTAEEIQQPYAAGEAMLWTAVHESGASRGDAAVQLALDGIRRIASPFWQAVGLVLVAGIKQKRGDADALDLHAKAQRLIAKIPEGEPRTQLREALADAALFTGEWDLAIDWVRKMTVDRPQRLLKLAHVLAAREAAEAVTKILPDCSHQLDTAYLVCPALSAVYPAHAPAIASLVAATVPAHRWDDDDEPAPSSAQEQRDQWLARHHDSGDDFSEFDDDSEEWRPIPEDPLADVALSDVVHGALRQAVSNLPPGGPLDTRIVLRWLMDADGTGDWTRIWLHFGSPAAITAAAIADPAPQPGGQYDATPLTDTCARALRTAARLCAEYDLWPMPPALLALGLVADPQSAAGRSLGVVDEATHAELVTLIQEDLLNANLNELDLSTDNEPQQDDLPPSWPIGLSANSECDPPDHVLEPVEPERDRNGSMVFTTLCGRCGVGCAIRVRQVGPTTLKTQLTVFPARGSYAISRQMIRWCFLSAEEHNQAAEQRGLTVIRETPVFKGAPQGP